MLRSLSLLSTIFCACSLAATAQTSIDLGGVEVNTTAAIEVTADSLSVDQDTGTAVFRGNVIIGQGDLRLSAGEVEVIYMAESSQIARLLATDDVTFVTATEAAEAQSAEYNVENGLLVLTGDVLLTQGASAISAEEMVINLEDGSATMAGRVRTVLQQSGD